ncbi:hypothetical protein HanPI659440_Chr12g0465101 [Helianthus annuus]|nr:hypothetical protein HanPI659440_Chr12g0465101 [Helianthus annuus]
MSEFGFSVSKGSWIIIFFWGQSTYQVWNLIGKWVLIGPILRYGYGCFGSKIETHTSPMN